jgi:hypothetical protein
MKNPALPVLLILLFAVPGCDVDQVYPPDVPGGNDVLRPDAGPDTANADSGPGNVVEPEDTCTLSSDCAEDHTCRHGFCMPSTLPQWELEIDPDDWRSIVAEPYDYVMVPCNLRVNGVEFPDCTARLSGGQSRDYRKKSLRIEFPKDAPTPGFARRINLRAHYADPSFLREYLGYEAFRSMTDIPTPRTRFLWLTLNGEPHGVMLEVERHGGAFLKARGRSSKDSMYEADPSHILTGEGGAAMLPLPDIDKYTQAFDKKTGPDDYSDLRRLIEDAVWNDFLDSTNGPATTRRIRQLVNIDRYIDYLAVMGLIQSHDHVRKNYYFSFQDQGNGRWGWEFYPVDLDMTFGCLWDEENQTTLCNRLVVDESWVRGIINADIRVGYPAEAFYNLLIHQVLSDPELRARFDARLCDMLDGPRWNDELPRRIDAAEKTIIEAVAFDTRDRNDSVGDFEQGVQELRMFHEQRADFLRRNIPCP